MERTFCYVCGEKLEKKEKGRWICANCGQDYYANPSPAVELALFNDKGEVLLSKRGREPSKGKWDVPGGFVDFEESAEEALVREIQEEIGMDEEDFTKPVFVRSYTGKYPWGKTTYEILVFLFVGRIKTSKRPQAKDDVADVKWVNPGDIDVSELSNPKFKDYILEAYDILKK